MLDLSVQMSRIFHHVDRSCGSQGGRVGMPTIPYIIHLSSLTVIFAQIHGMKEHTKNSGHLDVRFEAVARIALMSSIVDSQNSAVAALYNP